MAFNFSLKGSFTYYVHTWGGEGGSEKCDKVWQGGRGQKSRLLANVMNDPLKLAKYYKSITNFPNGTRILKLWSKSAFYCTICVRKIIFCMTFRTIYFWIFFNRSIVYKNFGTVTCINIGGSHFEMLENLFLIRVACNFLFFLI